MNTFQIATAELGDRDGQQYEKESKDGATKQQSPSDEEDGLILDALNEIEDFNARTEEAPQKPIANQAEVSTVSPQSFPHDLPQIALAALAAILLVGTFLYGTIKVLRSRNGRIGLALTLLAALAAGGFWFVDQRGQEERERVETQWATAFNDITVKDFDSCVSRKASIYSDTRYRVDKVKECGEVAKAIKQGMEAQ